MDSLKINDPRFNVREIAKQLILLEQHLLEQGKYCPDCITKHLLTVEALADECQLLDSRQEWCMIAIQLGQRAKWWSLSFARGVSPHAIGQDVRAVRKSIAQGVLSPEEVAASHQEAADYSGLFFTEGGDAKPAILLVGAGLLGLAVWWSERNRNHPVY